jgi:hypothetical protein
MPIAQDHGGGVFGMHVALLTKSAVLFLCKSATNQAFASGVCAIGFVNRVDSMYIVAIYTKPWPITCVARYGARHPDWVIGSYHDAVAEARRRARPLFVYIHNDNSIETNVFCTYVLDGKPMLATYAPQRPCNNSAAGVDMAIEYVCCCR